jgi:GAF domain-containing protein
MYQRNLGIEEEDEGEAESGIDGQIEQDWLKIENDQDVEDLFQKFLEDTLQLIKKVLVSNSVILLFANYEKQMFVVRHKITDYPDVFSPQNSFSIDKGLPSLVLRNRTPLIENHLPTGQEIIPYYLKDNNPSKSFAAVPIYYKDHIIGVLCTDSGVEEAFSNDDLSILKNFGNQIMLQLFGSNKLYEYESENWLVNILFEISQDLNQVQSVEALWKYLMQKIPEVIGCDRISISRKLNEKQGEILDIAGGTGNLKSGKIFAVNEGIVGWVIRKNQAILVEDFSQKENYVPRFSSNETPARDYFSLLALPIANNRNLIGVLCMESNRPRNFKEQHKRILQTICNQAANMYLTTHTLDQLKQINYRDLDTQLENINAFRFVFPKEFNRAHQLKYEISLLFVKCYFQLKEDDHDLSVRTLQEFLSLLLPQLNKSDYIFRLSPDTFGIVITSQGERKILEFGEKIIFKIRDKKIWADGEAFDFYAILGLVTSEFLSEDLDNILKLGEKTIKHARLKGPNQIMNYRNVLEDENKADRQLDMLDSNQ